VPYNLFRLFLVHKVLASKYICENGKKKWERKKRKDFPASRTEGGGISAHLAQPRGATAGNGAVAWARTPERGRVDGVNGTEGGEGARPRFGRRRAPRRFSAIGPVLRWGNGGEAWAGDGVTRVGRILPAGACGGRSAARWRVPAAVMPPVRLPATIEGEKWRPMTVRVWQSFWHSLIGQRIAREGEGSSPER
jgi:hypothetical protein